jgi:ferredoxin-nitrite reductase
MSINLMPAPIQEIEGKSFNPEQSNYLEGFFAGVQQRAVVFADLFPNLGASNQPVAEEDEVIVIAEERIKNEEHPLDSYYRLLENARGNKAPDKEETFRFKWEGLFFLTPVKDAFMARLRIPGGQLKSFQMRELASIAKDLTSGYVQITNRANFQIRLIKPKDTPDFLQRVQSVGLHTRGAGADNIRNLTCNPTAGVDPVELIDCSPFVRELGQYILSHREFYNLPRKFNVAFDGGGLIGAVEDTNDIGVKAVKHGDGVAFRISLGGATGHKAFATDCGALVAPEEIVDVVLALIRVFIANGNRGDRKRARLKHLLEKWSLEQYLEATEKVLGRAIPRAPLSALELIYPSEQLPHTHLGVHAQKQPGLYYIGVSFPVGQITPKQMLRLAELSELYGSGDLRLTVWQNLIIPNIPEAYLETVKKSLRHMGLDWQRSLIAGGVVACTGNRYCKYSSTDTKGDALALSQYLEKKFQLDQPVNIHVTGCPHSCAQHYIGDIGLIGVKSRDGGEAYHVLVGGGFGNRAACGRQIFQALPVQELNSTVEKMFRAYLKHRLPVERFQDFTARLDLNTLQILFTDED